MTHLYRYHGSSVSEEMLLGLGATVMVPSTGVGGVHKAASALAGTAANPEGPVSHGLDGRAVPASTAQVGKDAAPPGPGAGRRTARLRTDGAVPRPAPWRRVAAGL